MVSEKRPGGTGKRTEGLAENSSLSAEPDSGPPFATRYTPPAATDRSPKKLIALIGTRHERHFTFFDRIEIGRLYDGRQAQPGQLLVGDPTISSRHCIITQSPEGRCVVRDVSRNGTRLDGRRLVPNQEVEVQIGQTVTVGRNRELRLAGEAADASHAPTAPATMVSGSLFQVTILVGDIRDYTVLVREAPAARLQKAMGLVFQRLEREVVRLGGTVKEYQGDAIFAFWEKTVGKDHAVKACRAALALDRLAREIAVDRSIWDVPGFELAMDWALTTGTVVIDSYGGASPGGLSMIGEPVVLAFRLEKFASDSTGPVLACSATQNAAAAEFEFRDLGERQAKGFDKPDRVFGLVGARE